MNKSNKQKALEYFINQGLSPHAASGLVGTLLSESSLLPDSVNSSSGAYGIAQWLGPRKKELFKRYGSKPTFENLLEFVWHELGTTHKNGGQRLLTAKTPEEAADIAFGYYEFMNGPEGAVREMNRYGLNGAASRAQKRKYARDTYDVFYGPHAGVSPIEPNLRPATISVTQSPKMLLAPISLQQPTQIQYDKTLPDTEVIGYRRKTLQAPAVASLWDTLRQAIEYNLLKAAGMVPEDNNDDYTNMFIKPTLGLPHFAGGKDGWTPDQGWTVTRRGGKSYVSLGQPKEPTMKRPYWVTARTKQLDYDDLEKGYTAATAGMLPNYLTAARNFVQGDIQEGLVNLGMTADIQLTPDGTTYAVVAPGALDTYANAAKFFNKEFTRMFRTLGPVLTNTDRFVKFLQQRTGKTITRIPIKDSKIGDIYSRGYSYVDENGKEIAHIAGNKKPEGVFVESSYVSPEYRSQGIGKLMYFDFNEHTFNELGSTLRSSPYQHQSTLEIEPGSGIFISPSSKLWRGLKSNGLAEIGGSGLNRYYMMAEPSAINPLY